MTERNIDVEAKINALLELSKSTAEGTENEAKLALETAIRLAAKYNISLKYLAEKRKSYAGDWFRTDVKTETVEYSDERYRELQIKKWSDLAESFGWIRHTRNYDVKEGFIWSYRQENRYPKVELRIFERAWGDIEFEIVRNPDPILGKIEEWTKMGFDCLELGVTYYDFLDSLKRDQTTPLK